MPKKRKSFKDGATFWDNLDGWKTVDVGDDFLLGSEEAGFMGLEEIDPSALGIEVLEGGIFEHGVNDDHGVTASQRPATKKSKTSKQPTEKQLVDALTAKVAALEAENATLRRTTTKQPSGDGAQARKTTKAKATSTKGKRADNIDQRTENESLHQHDIEQIDMSAWEDHSLHTGVLAGLRSLGFTAPTQVQAECLPAAVRDRRDIIGAAQTGSGKTLAFGLPIVHLVAKKASLSLSPHQRPLERGGDDKDDDTALEEDVPTEGTEVPSDKLLRALVLAPTRELALQVYEHILAIAKPCGVAVVPVVGGLAPQKQERLLNKRPEIVVATPGRLWDLMRDGQIHVANMKGLRFLVVDEADRMVQQGHYGELANIFDAITASKGLNERADNDQEQADPKNDGAVAEESRMMERRHRDAVDNTTVDENNRQQRKKPSEPTLQTFVFSATLTLPSVLRKRLRRGGGGASGSASLDALMDRVPFAGQGRPKIVDLTPERRLADRVTEAYVSCPEAERDEYLYCLLAAHPGRTIVFVNAVSTVRRLGAVLRLLGLPVHPLHAGMQQRARLKALDRFKADCNGVLVATDVAARGLDVKNVRCVVHYQLPASVDTYVHRSGRTARAETEGIALALVTPKEDARFRALLRALGRDGTPPPEFPLDVSLMPESRKRVALAVELDALERRGKKERADTAWRRQHAEELGLELSDEDTDSDDAQDPATRRKGNGGKGESLRGDSSKAAALRARLNALLAKPLQPKFSKKFFTGGAAAGVASQRKKMASKGTERAATQVHGDRHAGEAATVAAAVSLAQRMADTTSGEQKNVRGTNNAVLESTKRPKRKAPMVGKIITRKAALAAALRKHTEKKSKARKGGMVVVKPWGREAEGPDALQVLRARLAATSNEGAA